MLLASNNEARPWPRPGKDGFHQGRISWEKKTFLWYHHSKELDSGVADSPYINTVTAWLLY